MKEQDLTPRERAILIALMTVGEKVSNNQLEERVGFRLDGKERDRVNKLGYVDSQKPGRAYLHEITKEGLKWCRREMSASRPTRSDSGTKSLYAVLASLDRYLQRNSKLELSDLFEPIQKEASDDDPIALDAKIRTAYDKLAGEPGDWVRLIDIRRRLSGAPRERVDAALLRLSTADGVGLVPDANQSGLAPEDRAAAVSIGGQDKHLITIREP